MSEDIYIEEIWREMGKLKSESRSLVAEAQAEIKELKDRIEDLEAALLIPLKKEKVKQKRRGGHLALQEIDHQMQYIRGVTND